MLMLEVDRGRLISYAARLLGDPAEAEDVVQEAFIRLREAEGRGVVACAPAWLHAVCYRIAVDRLRARRREEEALAGAAAARRGGIEVEGPGALDPAEIR